MDKDREPWHFMPWAGYDDGKFHVFSRRQKIVIWGIFISLFLFFTGMFIWA